MANRIADGTTITTATTGAKTNGQMTKIGSMVGVALTSGASGGKVAHALDGVFNVAKKAGASLSFVAGQKVYTLVTGGVVKATPTLATGELLVGTAMAVAATGATQVQCKLAGHALNVE